MEDVFVRSHVSPPQLLSIGNLRQKTTGENLIVPYQSVPTSHGLNFKSNFTKSLPPPPLLEIEFTVLHIYIYM